MDLECSGCQQKIPNRQYLTCSLCSNHYDIECANVSIQRFLNTMTLEHRKKWKCQVCICKTPKTGNINKAILPKNNDLPQHKKSPIEQNNVTTRKKTTSPVNNDSINSEDLSILGDTIVTDNSMHTKTELTLENLSQMITQKLKENNVSIILEIQNTIQLEINKAINKLKEDIAGDIDTLNSKNNERKQEIEKINEKIKRIQEENNNLKEEIKQLQHKIPETIPVYKESDNKKFVIYGLAEYYKETEYDLNTRITEILREYLNIDVFYSIEDTYRVGKYRNNNRPLVVELLSKKMVKYIHENKYYLEGTQLSIGEYLGEKERKERKQLREKMLKARKDGLHAIIRDNKLYIQGKQVKSGEEGETYIREEHNNTRSSFQHDNKTRSNYTRNNFRYQQDSSHSFRGNGSQF
ncbi:hypothetical protein JYU34_009938 [Plutella xylostella]|uniref:Uncharacterized protein n=1 Tax=Plutella xylostella TaxID=51655 RepID=A0ABQ7QLY7_PLUXY|nr:hypothetical protein JYU34_009938 [Plutella xylostella]